MASRNNSTHALYGDTLGTLMLILPLQITWGVIMYVEHFSIADLALTKD